MNRLLVFCLLAFAGAAHAQSGKVREAWVNHFPQAAWVNVFPDNLGRIAAVGLSTGITALVLLDANGVVVANTNDLSSFAQVAGADPSGNIYFAGNCAYGAVICAKKYHAGFSMQIWFYSYEFPIGGIGAVPKNANARDITSDDNGNIYVAGDYHPYTADYDYDAFALSFGNAGSRWVDTYKPYGEFDSERFPAGIRRTTSRKVYLVGGSYQWNWADGTSIFALAYDSDGHQFWISNYVSSISDGRHLDFSEVPSAIAVDSQENLLVTGWHSEVITDRRDVLTIKIAPTGEVLWRTTFNAPSGDKTATGVAVDASDNVIVTGSSGTLKYSSAGVQQWYSSEIGARVQIDSEGNVLLSGSVADASGRHYVQTTKLGSDGHRIWQARYDAGANSDNVFVNLFVDASNAVYLGVNSTNPDEAAVIKYVERGRTPPGRK
jgi:hypothetical protein